MFTVGTRISAPSTPARPGGEAIERLENLVGNAAETAYLTRRRDQLGRG